MLKFKAKLEIIDGNPFVFVPPPILDQIFEEANQNKGPIPIRGTINGRPYQQTLVKYSGAWRLYVNMKMLDDSPRRIGEILEVDLAYDPRDRTVTPHPKLVSALRNNRKAKEVFDRLAPSRQKEIIRYIANLKTDESVERNVKRAIDFLLGKTSFAGRDQP